MILNAVHTERVGNCVAHRWRSWAGRGWAEGLDRRCELWPITTELPLELLLSQTDLKYKQNLTSFSNCVFSFCANFVATKVVFLCVAATTKIGITLL
jgi:hypothetical protein